MGSYFYVLGTPLFYFISHVPFFHPVLGSWIMYVLSPPMFRRI